MGTEVMRSQDCLVDRFRVHPASFYRRRNITVHGNLKNIGTHPKQNSQKEDRKTTTPRHVQRKRSSPKSETSNKSRDGDVLDSRRRDEMTLAMGKITLLRRGEPLDSLAARLEGGNQQMNKSENQIPAHDVTSVVQDGDVIVPESRPEVAPTKILLEAIDTYAGTGFFLSPSPRALPLPSFFSNKYQEENNGGLVLRDSATRDLRRMLGLE